MKRLIVAPRARRDLAELYMFSEDRFGSHVRARYEQLVILAFRDLLENDQRAGVNSNEELPPGVRLYHLRHSRLRLPKGERITRPRHIIAFQNDALTIKILRVLHDAMDPPRHL